MGQFEWNASVQDVHKKAAAFGTRFVEERGP